MKILIITNYVPYPPVSGAEVRIYNLLRYISWEHEVSVISLFNSVAGDDRGAAHLRTLCHRVELVARKGRSVWGQRLKIARGMLRREPRKNVEEFFEEMARTIGDVTREEHFDIVSGNEFRYKDRSFKYGKKWTTINMGTFEGMFIHRRCIDKIGYPDYRFFIGGDDVIYGFLASLYTNVIYINEVCMINKRKGDVRFLYGERSCRLSDVGLYYSMRNRFLEARRRLCPNAE